MKTKLFTLLIIAVASTTTMFAQKVVMLQKTEYTASGCIKEYIILDRDYSTPLKKIVFEYNPQGYIEKRTVYVYNFRKEPVALHQLECRYDDKNNPTSFVLTKWDKKSQKWSDKSEEMSYCYHNSGGVAVQQAIVPHNFLAEDLLTIQ